MNKLSTKHFMFFIFCTIVVSLRLYSSVFIKYGGRDTWIIVILSSLVMTLCYIYILHISQKTNTLSINDIYKNTYPSFIYYIMLGLFCIGLFLASVESVSAYASSLRTNLFINTPIWYSIIFLLLPACYILTRKFNSILIITIITGTLAIIGDIIYIALIIKYLKPLFIFPIMQYGLNTSLINCFFLVLGSLSSVMITIPILKYLNSKENLVKNSLISILLSCLLIDASIFSLITFFGPTRAANIFYPEFIQSQRIQIAHFIEFGEIFFIFRNVCMWFLKYIIASYGLITLLNDKNSPLKIKNKYVFICIYNILIFAFSIFLTKEQYLFFDYLEVLQYIFLVILLIIPLLTYTIYNIKFSKK